MPRLLPFTWPEFEKEIGRELPASVKRRLDRCVKDPARWWTDARSIGVAPEMGKTLWQCVQAVGMARYEDGRVPSREMIIYGLCYAAGIPRQGVR